MRIVCDATLAFIKRCSVLSPIIEMADFCEQCACIKFCFKLGKTATECYEMLKTAFGEQAMGHSQTFQWFSRFKAGRTSINDDDCSGRPVSSSTPEMILCACACVRACARARAISWEMVPNFQRMKLQIYKQIPYPLSSHIQLVLPQGCLLAH